jgi:hypothetical protein
MLTKSSHGGKRPGAGRPRSDDSIRGQLESAAANPKCTHSFTRWEVARDLYVSNHAHTLVLWLAEALDKSRRVAEQKRLISRARAYQIAHIPKDRQPHHLRLFHSHVLHKAVEQYGQSPNDLDQRYAQICNHLLSDEDADPNFGLKQKRAKRRSA